MTKIKGITVTLVDKVEVGKDPFGTVLHKDVDIDVANVLVSPTSTDDVVNEMNLTGKRAIYTLAIPKGDNHEWANREVKFFGKTWRTIGIPLEGIEEMIPLDWNKKVTVEAYE